jgi:hypothetical protein
MGYGITPNALSGSEGGMSRYFSQRFAQVTNLAFAALPTWLQTSAKA